MTQGIQEEKQKNFICTPNVLFVSYKYLTIEEKYLWQDLKRMYWDGKPRYMSLRELNEVTGYSIGALSKMLPRLDKCQLLDAKIEKQDGKGNPKYRIVVLDITEFNKQYFSCSFGEQVSLDPSLELVHQMNKSVQKNVQACSPNERPRSPKGTGSFTKRDKPVQDVNENDPLKPHGESDDETPIDLSIDPLKISLQMTEDRDALPPPSLPEDSSSSFDNGSQNIRNSIQGSATGQPSSVGVSLSTATSGGSVSSARGAISSNPGGDTQSAKNLGLTDHLPHAEDNPIAVSNPTHSEDKQGANEPQDSDAGYKTADSDVLNATTQNVIQNSTVLLSWLTALEQEETEMVAGRRIRHFSVGRIAGDEEAMKRLLSAVSSLDNLRDLYKIVRSQPLFRDGKLIYALNLANPGMLALYETSRPIEPMQRLTVATRNALERDIRAEYPALWVQQADDADFGLILLIWYGDEQADYILVRDREDWQSWRVDPLLQRAVEYAQAVLQSEQAAGQPQLEAVAV